MTGSTYSNPDAAVLNEIRELTKRLGDRRTQGILRSVIDAVALNPQPLPPLLIAREPGIRFLNPQPLPPG